MSTRKQPQPHPLFDYLPPYTRQAGSTPRRVVGLPPDVYSRLSSLAEQLDTPMHAALSALLNHYDETQEG